MIGRDAIVVKVGTGVLTRKDGTLDSASLARLVNALADLPDQGKRVVLVSSGAVGAGISALGLRSIRMMYLHGKQLPPWVRPGSCMPTKIFFEALTLVWRSFFSLRLILKTMIAVAGPALFLGVLLMSRVSCR